MEYSSLKSLENIFLGVLAIMLSYCASYSQTNQIEYSFSKEVNTALNEKFRLHSSSGTNFYLLLNQLEYIDACGNYVLSIGRVTNDEGSLIKDLVLMSNHYYRFGDINVPIIFQHDFTFRSYGTDDKGRVIRKNLIDGTIDHIEFKLHEGIVGK